MKDLIEKHELLIKLVAEQAEAYSLWAEPDNLREADLKYEIRRLHRLIETGVYPVD